MGKNNTYLRVICEKENCNTAFDINFNKLPAKKSITCPNCESKLKDEIFEKVQSFATTYQRIILPAEWKFSIIEK